VVSKITQHEVLRLIVYKSLTTCIWRLRLPSSNTFIMYLIILVNTKEVSEMGLGAGK